MTPALSAAVQARSVCWPTLKTSPPFGAVTVTTGGMVSANVAAQVWLRSMTTTSGLVVVEVSPLQPTKTKPAAGTAVRVTESP